MAKVHRTHQPPCDSVRSYARETGRYRVAADKNSQSLRERSVLLRSKSRLSLLFHLADNRLKRIHLLLPQLDDVSAIVDANFFALES